MSKIKDIKAIEILDSRGNPTLKVTVFLDNGISASACVPSGASCGRYEASELRDNDPGRFQGKGVISACQNVNKKIVQRLKGMEVSDQEKIDRVMCELDGTENKSKLGANAILGVSLAVCRAAAKQEGVELFQYLKKIFPGKISQDLFKMPRPMFNLINGGRHANFQLDIQEFMLVPETVIFSERVRYGSEIFHLLAEVLAKQGFTTGLGDEGGFMPKLATNEQAMRLICESAEQAGLRSGKDFFLALDAAASEFYNKSEDKYILKLEKISLSSDQLIALYMEWCEKFPIISLEDPLAEDDWDGWTKITKKLGKKIRIVGDDLFVTNISRLEKGIACSAANAILIKPNQIGTVTETLNCIRKAKEANFKVIISHRSGETCDTFISDLAYACQADFIKAGSMARSERVAKYNRLLEIENLNKQ